MAAFGLGRRQRLPDRPIPPSNSMTGLNLSGWVSCGCNPHGVNLAVSATTQMESPRKVAETTS